MIKIVVIYPSKLKSEKEFLKIDDALNALENLFYNSLEGRMTGGFIELHYKNKEQTFFTDGGIQFNNWCDNLKGPWGSKDEFFKD